MWVFGDTVAWVDRARGHTGDDKDATVVAVTWLWNGARYVNAESRKVWE